MAPLGPRVNGESRASAAAIGPTGGDTALIPQTISG
jgi:hypothetical protein